MNELSYELMPEDVLAGIGYSRRTTMRSKVAVLVTCAVVFEIVVILLPLLTSIPMGVAVFMSIYIPVYFMAVAAIYRRLLPILQRRIMEGKHPMLGRSTLRITETGLEYGKVGKAKKYRWKSVTRIAETPEHLFLLVGGYNTIIPKRAVDSDKQWRRLAEELRQRATRARYFDERSHGSVRFLRLLRLEWYSAGLD